LLDNLINMKKPFTLFVALFAIILFSSGCKKKHDDQPATKTRTELISSGTWKFSGATSSGFDVSSFIQSCQKDNTLTFHTDGTGVIDEGTTKCNVADPQSSSYNWNFTNSENGLHVSTVLFSSGSNDFNIVSLTSSQLVGSQTINGQLVIVTFIH
jgi:hypothetical protein